MNQLRQQWMEHHPDIEPLERARNQADEPYVAPGDMAIEEELVYKVEIKTAALHTNNFGDKQLRLKLRVLTDSDEHEVGTHTEHMTLPFQESDMHVGDQEMVRKRHTRRVQDVTRIFSACQPERFALYDCKQNGSFYDFDGNVLDKESFKVREKATNDATLDMVDHIHSLRKGDLVEALTGTRLYMRRVPNKKKPRYPYTNFYAKKPSAQVGSDAFVFFDGFDGGGDIPF